MPAVHEGHVQRLGAQALTGVQKHGEQCPASRVEGQVWELHVLGSLHKNISAASTHDARSFSQSGVTRRIATIRKALNLKPNKP